MTKILYTTLLGLLAVGCNHSPEFDTTPSDEVLIEFSNTGAITKAEVSSASQEDLQFSLVRQNYSIPTSTSIYTYNPADNSLTRKEGERGLCVNTSYYYNLTIASPATDMEQVGNTSYYGHVIERSSDTPLYINDPILVYVDGIAISTGGYSYIHDLGEVTLKEKRSRVKVSFKSNLADAPRTVSTLYFKDVYNRAYSCLEAGTLFSDDYPNTNEVEEFVDFPESPQTYNSNTDYTTAKTEDEDDFTYFISSDYSAKDALYPTLVVGLPDGDDIREVNVPLNILMEPMKNYTCEINISSMVLEINVIESDWFDGGEHEGIIDPIAKYTINIATGEIEWEIGGDNTIIDVPTEDEVTQTVDFTTEESSNCYILNPDANGTSVYYIPITRISEFWEDATYVEDRYVAKGVQEALYYERWEPVMYWHDFNNPIIYAPINDVKIEKSVSPSSGDPCVKVSIPKEMAQRENHCNIGYVVRKTDNNDVMWSWHLWVTDYNPYGEQSITTDKFVYSVEGGELHRYDNDIFNSGIYSDKLIMDRNLGARSADFEGHGSMTSDTVTAPGTIYYQFGRKDPFPAYRNMVSGYTYAAKAGQLSFEDGVLSPNNYITYPGGNWCNEGDDVDFIWNDHSISKTGYKGGKSIFDPSPQGFRMPINGTWAEFTSGSADQENKDPDSYTFKLINNENGTSTVPYDREYMYFAYYPALGYRNYNSGGFNGVGSYSYYWSASPSSATHGFDLNFFTTGVITYNQHLRAFGYPVRPIQE